MQKICKQYARNMQEIPRKCGNYVLILCHYTTCHYK